MTPCGSLRRADVTLGAELIEELRDTLKGVSHGIIVKQHAGLIEVDTRPGEFTEIRVILPRSAVFVQGEQAGLVT
jgi:nitrogen-specific signal transduction histidine kinase